MNNPASPVTVVLANRPRLFRELLQHALNTASPRFRVVEVADATPTPSILHDADWVVVDEDSAPVVEKMTASHPNLGILSLEGRGSRVRVLAPSSQANTWQQVPEVRTLTTLFELLSHHPDQLSK